jgi:two-component system response regulator HydG
MRALVADLRRFAVTDANVLVTGETGAGKDAVARALHVLSGRGALPFVTIDCPGIPPSLLESELFGHERGAFTDAATSRAGRFEVADGGTVYIDRVHELPLDLQPKLLRIVELKQVERLGSALALPVKARIVASADERAEQAVRDGTFRADLYHRLRVLPLRVPPLRERRADLLPLARTLLARAAARTGRQAPGLSHDASARITSHSWPGNVRELGHVLERALLASSAPTLTAGDLPIDDVQSPDPLDAVAADRPTIDELERRYIVRVLAEVRGSQTKAAAILGISRKALWEKRRRYGME